MIESHTHDRRERSAAAITAGAVGDALGWPFERNNQRLGGRKRTLQPSGKFFGWTRKAGGRFYGFEEPIGAGEYSDDTQLVVATARALLSSDWYEEFTRRELPVWLLYERGGGRSVKAAAQAWAKGLAPWSSGNTSAKKYLEAGGNGAAMRVFPHSVVSNGNGGQLHKDVLLNALSTHGHPRALVGALLHAVAGSVALSKKGTWPLGALLKSVMESSVWQEPPTEQLQVDRDDDDLGEFLTAKAFRASWKETVDETIGNLSTASDALSGGALAIDKNVLRSLGAFDPNRQGTGTTAAVCAIYLASRYAADPATGIRVAAYADGSDTDTIASMTGSLLGAMLGPDWIPPEWKEVQDFDFLWQLGARLHDRGHPIALRERHSADYWIESDSKKTIAQIKNYQSGSLSLGPIGTAQIMKKEALAPIARGVIAERWMLKGEQGQTIFLTRLGKTSAQKLAAERKPSEQLDLGYIATNRPVISSRSLSDEIEQVVASLPANFDARRFGQALVTAIRSAREDVSNGDSTSRPWNDPRKRLVDSLAHLIPHAPNSLLRNLARLAEKVVDLERKGEAGQSIIDER
jgi:ADP-ribosylglycohydrolase